MSLKLLGKLPAEQNKIVTNFDLIGIKGNTAFDSQVLFELKNNYAIIRNVCNAALEIKY